MIRNALIIVWCAVFLGCAHPPKSTVVGPLVEPQYGMTKQEMLSQLGTPDSVEIYKKTDESRMEFDIYTRKYPTSVYKLPICLIKDKVVGWGQTYYEDHINPDDMTRIK